MYEGTGSERDLGWRGDPVVPTGGPSEGLGNSEDNYWARLFASYDNPDFVADMAYVLKGYYRMYCGKPSLTLELGECPAIIVIFLATWLPSV